VAAELEGAFHLEVFDLGLVSHPLVLLPALCRSHSIHSSAYWIGPADPVRVGLMVGKSELVRAAGYVSVKK